jgi:hypothetical protein
MNNNLVEIALGIYKTFGRSAAKRALTPPRAWVEKACAGTGANVAEALEERDEWVEELLEFLESIVDSDFVDPD